MAPTQPRHNPIPCPSATLSQPQKYPVWPVLFIPPRAVSDPVHRSTTCNTLTHARTLRHGSGGTVRELLPPLPPIVPIPHWDGTPTHPEVAAVRVAWRAPSSQNPPVSPSDISLPLNRATFLSLFLLFSSSLDHIPWLPACLLPAHSPASVRRQIDQLKEIKETAQEFEKLERMMHASPPEAARPIDP